MALHVPSVSSRSLQAACVMAIVTIGAGAASSGCAKKSSESTFLQAQDLAKNEALLDFVAGEIIESASFTDTLTLDAVAIQNFLAKTPYKRPSFLQTYQSNGVRASDAVVRAGAAYRINPLFLLVRAQVDQGLIGEQFYPFPPSRVEYVFGCGCPGGGSSCDPALAGFDRQVDCVARKLRTSLDEIAGSGQTAGNWGPGKQSVTIDGVRLTPVDDSTAALYQYSPTVGLGKGGNWLVWNIWQNYATATDYFGPIVTDGGGAWTGDSCTSDMVCVAPAAFCAKDFPGGMCTVQCTKQDCPQDPMRPVSFCADFAALGGYCLPVCDPTVSGVCRPGYTCKPVAKLGASTATQSGCTKNM